jgi:Lrp/AsnC family transcriptional regulator, leucine-responsive regulatory protein
LYIADMELDEIDYRILEVLQRDGRISNQDLADRVGLSPSPCLRRVRALERSGVVQRYVALLDAVALGYELQAIVEVRLDRQRNTTAHRFEKEISKYPQVLECYQLAGDWDYALRVVTRDLEAFREFCVNTLSKMAGVGTVKSNISMKQVKYSTAILLERNERRNLRAGGQRAGLSRRA